MNNIILQGDAEKIENIHYEVDLAQEPIGVGGMGQVFVGTRVDDSNGSKTLVAVKFLFSDLPPRAVERSRREAMVQLRNDNVIKMYGFIETQSMGENGTMQSRYHVVSELLNGVSLEDLLHSKFTDRNGNIVRYAQELYDTYLKDSVRFAKIITKSVLSGLMALHDLKYIHRDIDPSNIMITEDRHIKLIDFGICKNMDSLTTGDKSLTVSGRFMGKPHYASPELAIGDISHQDYSTDIYAVGIMLYQCITGHVPFEGALTEVLDMQVHTPLPLKDIKHSGMRRIIQKACEKNQFKRYQTAAEMRVDIESLDIRRAEDPRKRNFIISIALIVIMVIVGCVIGIWVHNGNVEAERVAMAEKNYTDSLLNIINVNVAAAENLAAKGYLHDENYDLLLIEAKHHYDKADAAKSELIDGSKVPSYDISKQRLIEAMKECIQELSTKVEILSEDPDPAVVEEVNVIKVRVENVKNAINSK